MTDTLAHLLPDAHVTWCATLGQYAAEDCSVRHDHHDIAITEDGRILFRYWPIGTVLSAPDGSLYRITRYDLSMAGESAGNPAAPKVPQYDMLGPGGHSASVGWDSAPDPRTLTVIEHPDIDSMTEVPIGALYVRPVSGETWRLVGKPLSELSNPTWLIGDGRQRRDAAAPPADARLIWVP